MRICCWYWHWLPLNEYYRYSSKIAPCQYSSINLMNSNGLFTFFHKTSIPGIKDMCIPQWFAKTQIKPMSMTVGALTQLHTTTTIWSRLNTTYCLTGPQKRDVSDTSTQFSSFKEQVLADIDPLIPFQSIPKENIKRLKTHSYLIMRRMRPWLRECFKLYKL